MEVINMNVTGTATKLPKEATVFVDEQDLEKKAKQVKKSRELFGKEHDLVGKENTKGSKGDNEEQQTAKTEKENYPGDVTLEEKSERKTNHLIEREDVQKVLAPLMAKLTLSKAQFIAMSPKNHDKSEDEDELGVVVVVEVEREDEANVVVENNYDSASNVEKEKQRMSKLQSEYPEEDMMNRCKRAIKFAIENVEIRDHYF